MTDRQPTGPDRDRPSCDATTRAGAPCRGTALPGRSRCFAHAEHLEPVRAEARVRGGEHSSNTHRALASMPEPIAEAVLRLRVAMDEVHRGELEPSRANAVAHCARALAQVWDVHVVEGRLDELEDHVAAATGRHLRAVP